MKTAQSILNRLKELSWLELKMISRRAEERATKSFQVLIDPNDFKLIEVDQNWSHITSFSSSEVTNRSFLELVPKQHRSRARSHVNEISDDGEFKRFKCCLIRKDGNQISVNWYVRYLAEIELLVCIGHVGIYDFAKCLEMNVKE